MGHSDISVTAKIYTHMVDEVFEQNRKRLAEYANQKEQKQLTNKCKKEVGIVHKLNHPYLKICRQTIYNHNEKKQLISTKDNHEQELGIHLKSMYMLYLSSLRP